MNTVIYQKHLHRLSREVRFLVWLDETASGKPIVRISRSDAGDDDPLNDILVIGMQPVEIRVEHRNENTAVEVIRMQQIKVPGT